MGKGRIKIDMDTGMKRNGLDSQQGSDSCKQDMCRGTIGGRLMSTGFSMKFSYYTIFFFLMKVILIRMG